MSITARVVVETALTLLAAEGEAGLGFNRVARELGIKPPSLYNHVGGSDDLRRRVAIRGWELFTTEAETAAKKARGASALRALGRAYRAFAKGSPGLFGIMGSVPLVPSDPDFAPVAMRTMQLFVGVLEQLAVPPKDRVHALRALRAAVHGFVVLERQQQFGMDEQTDESFEKMLTLLARGLSD